MMPIFFPGFRLWAFCFYNKYKNIANNKRSNLERGCYMNRVKFIDISELLIQSIIVSVIITTLFVLIGS